MIFLFACGIIILCGIIFDISYRFRNVRIMELSKLVPGPKGLPLLGNLFLLSGGPKAFVEIFRDLNEKFDGMFKLWLGYNFYVYVSKPQDIEAALNGSVEKEYYLKFVSQHIGDGLLVSPAHVWKIRRKLIQSSFNTKILNNFHDIMVTNSQILAEKFVDKLDIGYFDCFPNIFACTVDILFETTLKYKMDFQKGTDPKFLDYTSNVTSLAVHWMGQFWYHINLTYRCSKLRTIIDAHVGYLHAMSSKIVREKTIDLRNRQDTSMQYPFLEHLIKAKETGFPISNKSIENEMNTMIIAGSDTTANVMCFVLTCLGVLQDIQRKVHEELDSIFGGSDRDCTLDDIKSMNYLEMVIKETMRMFTPVPLLARFNTQDVKLSSITMPRNTNSVLGLLQMHRSPEIYPDPLKFDPNRFSPEETAKRHSYAFIPFGGGPRNCIGQKFAYISMKIILATLLRQYRVYSDVDLAKIDLKMEIFLKPVNGFRIRLQARNKCSQ